MGDLLSLYFLHPITTRLANKTQRFNPRYELTNPTKTTPSPFAFSLLSPFLLHLHYTLQSPSPSVTTPPFLCYSVSSSPVTIPCSFVTLSSLTLSLLSSSSVTTLCSHVTLSSFYPVPPPCRVKNVYLSYPQGPLLCPRQGLSSMQNMPFLPLEDAFLVPWTCPSWRHVFKSLIVRRLW